MSDATTRFSNRVENYVKWRPTYPVGVTTSLVQTCGLRPDWLIADVGSGPGNLTKLLLDFGARVAGVEPNQAMRAAGETLLKAYPSFLSVPGSAEATGLADASVDLVTAGQAFHWFEVEAARREFQRILKEPKWVALIWNDRPAAQTPFLTAYEGLLLQRSRDYLSVRHQDRASDAVLSQFFGPAGFHQIVLPNEQMFDAEGLRGRLLSSSYAPLESEAGYQEMLIDLDRIFEEYQADGVVHFLYDTRVYIGRLTG